MAKRTHWTDFRRRFEDLQATEESCEAQLGAEVLKAFYYPDGSGFLGRGISVKGIPGQWEVVGAGTPRVSRPMRLRLAAEFQLIASRAAVAAGCPDCPESWVYWLSAMRQKKVVFGAAARLAPPLEKGGSPIEATPGSQDSVRVEMFYEISERSADFCEFLASGTEFPLVGESAREENKGGACSWGQVDIGFVDSDSVRLKVKGRSLGRKTFTEMGFADGRSGRTDKTKVSPQKAWLLLELIARKGELRAPPRSSSKRKRDDAAEQFHAAQRGSEEWVPASRATAGPHKVPQDDPSTARKLIQKMRRLLRKKLKSLGYAIHSNSDPLPCRDGKWRAAFTLTHDETDRP